jgi:hypothetical protein
VDAAGDRAQAGGEVAGGGGAPGVGEPLDQDTGQEGLVN